MNEASSKFVDEFALEKLVQEKLSKAHHSPHNSLFSAEEEVFENFGGLRFNASSMTMMEISSTHLVVRAPSLRRTEAYAENNWVYLHYYPALQAKGNVLFVHGLFDDNLMNYQFLFQLLNEAGFNVFCFILPYHFERKPAASLFSGEYYWSADLLRSRFAVKQGVFDLGTAVRMIRQLIPLPTVLAGFSMGGNLSLRYFLLEEAVDGVFLINPVTRLSQLIWESPLLSTVRKDLEVAGYTLEQAEKCFAALDPIKNIRDEQVIKKIVLGYSVYDQVVGEAKFLDLIARFQFAMVIPYKAGHLNILRVPKLAVDLSRYFDLVVHGGLSDECG